MFVCDERKEQTMSTEKLNDILAELRKPFHPTDVYWKPGMVSSDKSKALALPYASLRAYQNRLDEVCGAEWSVTYTPWGERVIAHLTIGGVTRSSTGEPDTQAEKSEIAGTAAEAQAFKRACSAFSLGRYLYSLPTVWVDYDAQAKAFTAHAKAKLEGIVALHYQRALQSEPVAEQSPSPNAEATETQQQEDAAAANERSQEPDPRLDKLRKQFHQLGRDLYGESWDQVRHHNVERITGGQSASATDLTAEQLQKLIDGLKQLKRNRRPKRAGQQQAQA
jgi:hypothetical protein